MSGSAGARRSDRRIVRGRAQLAVSAFAAWVILCPAAALAAPGDLDPTFGDGGWAFTEVAGYDGFYDAVLQPDGRTIVVASADDRMSAWRLGPDGDPDPSFGGDGQATIAFARRSGAGAVALQPDGKLVIAGYAGRRVALARLRPDGQLDPSFGAGGSTTIRLEDKAMGTDVAIASDGGIVVGASFVEGRPPYRYELGTRLLRLDSQGTQDVTFGSQGVVSFGDRRLGDLALAEDDSIVVSLLGPIYRFELRFFFVARLDADGMADPTFSGDGIRRYLIKRLNRPSHIVVDPDAGILLAVSGYSDRCLFGQGGVVSLTPEGALDESFSGDGVARLGCMLVRRVAVAGDGGILAAGAVQFGGGSGELASTLSRLDPSGSIDASFGDDGTVISQPMHDFWTDTVRLMIQQDGKAVLVAGGAFPLGFAVGRVLTA